MLLMNTVLALTLMCLDFTSGQHSYKYWSNEGIKLTKLFAIDHSNDLIVLAAKNSICHLTLDLQRTINIQNTTPTDNETIFCLTDSSIFKALDECQNYHHILHFFEEDDVLANNVSVPLNETVLICGSNAYQPKCTYRYRTNLTFIAAYPGKNVCPFDRETVAASIVTRNGNLLSATSLNVRVNQYGFTLSASPFIGQTTVRTIVDQITFDKPIFVDLYEHGEFYYIFFREIATEEDPAPIYSRVARVCKNDTGISDVSVNYKVFTTYFKARIVCTSTLKSANDFPYTYNDIQDTVYIANGTIDSSLHGDYMYAIFNSPENAPAGSVLCVYTFDDRNNNDLTNVFTKPFLVRTGFGVWQQQTNNINSFCANRTKKNATTQVLMAQTVSQVGQPLLQQDGLLYKKLLVDQVMGIDEVKYDVLLIVATTEDNLYFFKKTYVSSREGDKSHTIQSVPLQRNSNNGTGQDVGKMELYKSDNNVSVYISTSEGLYTLSLSNCSMYTNCKECINSRDPYCAYDIDTMKCVNTHSNNSDNLLQDIVNGDDNRCQVITSSIVATPFPSTTSTISTISTSSLTLATRHSMTSSLVTTTPTSITIKETTTNKIIPSRTVTVSSTKEQPTEKSTQEPLRTVDIEPSVRPVSEQQEDHTWTIVAGGGGLIVGVVLGLILFALIRNKDKFCWGRFLSRRQRYNFDDDEKQYEMPTLIKTERNNADYTKSFQRSSTPPLSKLGQPTSMTPEKVTDSPILSKYTNTGKTHNRSMSSGGQILPFTIPTNGTSTPLSSPMGPNLRKTFHVEEPVTNTQRQKYGKNVVGRQLSKEYPMNPNGGYHMKTNSLDLEYEFHTYKNAIFES